MQVQELLQNLNNIYQYGIIKVNNIECIVPYHYVKKSNFLKILDTKTKKLWYNHKELTTIYKNDKDEDIYLLFELTEFILCFIGISDTITLKKMLKKKRKEFNNATKQQTERTLKGKQMLNKLTDYFENKTKGNSNEK